MLPDRESMEDDSHFAVFAASQSRCAGCWIDERNVQVHRFPGALQTHHLVKRSRRVCHLPWNLLRLCERCHRLAEGERIRVDGALLPRLTFDICLLLKRESDPANWQPDLLAELYGRGMPSLPELVRAEIPAFLLRERDRWQPYPDWRTLHGQGA